MTRTLEERMYFHPETTFNYYFGKQTNVGYLTHFLVDNMQ